MSTNATLPWWADAVIYQLYVRSFRDGDGDGIGDLAGVRAGLRHIADLGADGIWLNPCYPSPQHDHGYDVADYFGVEPAYGDLAAFDALVAEAKALGLRVLMDVVPNHCSIDHEWFQAALAAGPGSPERARFWFRDGRGEHGELPPNNWVSAFTGPAWTRVVGADGVPEQWYLNTFASEQPDWNWNHPDVVDHFDRVLRFWLDRGVDGYRVDAPTPVGKHPDLPDAPEPPPGAPALDARRLNPHTNFRPEGHDVWRHWRAVLDEYEATHPGVRTVMVAETYNPHMPERIAEFVRPDEYHQAFAFELMLAPWTAASMRASITEVLAARDNRAEAAAWTLNNHDAQRSVTRYGRADAATHVSISALTPSRAPVDVAVGTRRHRAALVLMLGLPGGLYLYQGEELGLPEVLDLPDAARQDPVFLRSGGAELGRDGCRVPLPWTNDPAANFGFSTATATATAGAVPGAAPSAPWLPQPADWGRYGADAQVGDATSMLELYRRALATRRRLAFGAEAFAWVDHDALLVFRRGPVVVVTNLTTGAQVLPSELGGREPVLASVPDAVVGGQLAADACAWFVLD